MLFRSKVKIICPEHGVFEQPAYNHYKLGCGCSKCAGNVQYTTEEFIEKAKKVHGDKYNYSLVKYKNAKSKIKINCKEHGVFEQGANDHLSGSGCMNCGGGYQSNTKEFIEKAKKIHGNKYNYSLVDYKNRKTNVIIICPNHGEFEQTPATHLKGSNCIKCALRGNTKDFIKRSIEIHGNKYDYSLVDYKFNYKKVMIKCGKHGIFNQIPRSHLSGHGCPTCKESKGEIEVSKLLKENKISFEREFIFKECKYIKELPFDFYIKELNTCIEYHGKQHFESIKHFGGEERLKEQMIKDEIKRNFCKENGINLIEIAYNEKVENKLKECLKENHI